MFNGRRQPSCDGTSRMTRECQVRFCERLGVKFPGLLGNGPHYRTAALLYLPQLAEAVRAAKRFQVMPGAVVSRCSKTDYSITSSAVRATSPAS